MAKTIARVSAQFYQPKMNDDIKKYIQQSVVCQKTKSEIALLVGPTTTNSSASLGGYGNGFHCLVTPNLRLPSHYGGNRQID